MFVSIGLAKTSEGVWVVVFSALTHNLKKITFKVECMLMRQAKHELYGVIRKRRSGCRWPFQHWCNLKLQWRACGQSPSRAAAIWGLTSPESTITTLKNNDKGRLCTLILNSQRALFSAQVKSAKAIYYMSTCSS